LNDDFFVTNDSMPTRVVEQCSQRQEMPLYYKVKECAVERVKTVKRR
jgi:hypothetical protein